MKKRIFKQGMALMLAAALVLPANLVPAEIQEPKVQTELPHIVLNQEEPKEKVTDSNAVQNEQTGTQTETKTESAVKTETKTEVKEAAEQIIYNTGSFNVHVVSAEDFANDLGDAYFEEDGSYTINIPEENPFFPYEVQFTYDGKTENEWFMNPEDSIEIDGHTFYVSASFDGTAVTQLTMDVAGREVVVYPAEKEFTDGNGVAEMSLLPLEKRYLYVDLTGFTPIELTRVKVGTLFTGENQLEDTSALLWKRWDGEWEKIEPVRSDDYLNISSGTSGLGGDECINATWEMIAGEYDQLASSNIRYYIETAMTNSWRWMSATVKVQNEDGTTQDDGILEVETTYYDDTYYYDENEDLIAGEAEVYVVGTEDIKDKNLAVSLKINLDQFEKTSIAKLELGDPTKGYELKNEGGEWYLTWSTQDDTSDLVVLKAFDAGNNEIGQLKFEPYVAISKDYLSTDLYKLDGRSASYNSRTATDVNDRSWKNCTYTLPADYAVNDIYRLVLTYRKAYAESPNHVLGAYVGKYQTLNAAKSSGAADIKESLFNKDKGYEADFSKGVYISVFVGKDDDTFTLFGYHVQTLAKNISKESTAVRFISVNDAEGLGVNNVILKDDYADYSFVTMIVDEKADLTALAPIFTTSESGIKVYTDKEEISGESLHDFSNGPVHYTASSKSSTESKNYWLQIIKPDMEGKQLYTNSLMDENSHTRTENGVVYTTREVMLNGNYDYSHDIILTNVGVEPLSKLSVEAAGESFDSGAVKLDDYWTLKGKHDLFGFAGFWEDQGVSLAKVRLAIGDDAKANGQELKGTLTIKEDGKTIMVMTLTGVVGDPGIVTTEIPDAVKYVHYGTMIQNNNRYNLNTTSYTVTSGKLPKGMELKQNGELYGVPLETGSFTFTVRMKNSYSGFRSSSRQFTLKVTDNTDANVNNAVDQGYDLKERVPDILLSDNNDYTMTSIGVIEEWDNLTLDGKRLVEGVDFDAKSGSTRLTIRSQTLKANNQVGIHTLSAEFREKGTGTLKRAAQNYRVNKKTSGGSSSGGNSSGGHSSSGSRATVRADVGNIGADGAWMQDAKGWKCKAADGTWYTNCWKELTYQNEKSWYRFDGQGYLVTGWYQENGTWYYLNPKSNGKLGKMMTGWQYIDNTWYYLTENAGDKQGAMYSGRWAQLPYNGTVEWYYFEQNGAMKTDWLTQDKNKYYLYPIADGTRGRMLTGWQKIGDNWYYFHEESDGNKGVLARRTRIGNYYVNSDGVWAK